MEKNFVASVNSIVTSNGGTVRVTVVMKELHERGTSVQFARTLRAWGFKVEKNSADRGTLTVFGTSKIPEEPKADATPEPEPVAEPEPEPEPEPVVEPLISDKLAADIESAFAELQSGTSTIRDGIRSAEIKYSTNLHDTKLAPDAFNWLECAGVIGGNRICHEVLVTGYDGTHGFERHIRVCTLAPEYQKVTWDEIRGELTTCDAVVKLAREKIAAALTDDAKKFFEAFGFGTHAELVKYIKSHQLMTYPLYSHKDFPQDILDQCLENLQRDNFITPDPYGFALSAKALRKVLKCAEEKLAKDPSAVVPTWIHSKLAQHRLEAENAPVEVEAKSESEPAPEAEPESTEVNWDGIMSQILDVMTRSTGGSAKSLSPDEIAEAMGVELTDALINSIHALDYVGMIFKADSNDGERYTLSDAATKFGMHKPEPEPEIEPEPAKPVEYDSDEDKVIDAMRQSPLGDTKSLSTYDIAKALCVTHDGDFRATLRNMASAGKIINVGSNAKADYYKLPDDAQRAEPEPEAAIASTEASAASSPFDDFTENQRLVYDTVCRLNKEGAPSGALDLVAATGLTQQDIIGATCKLNGLYWMSNDWVTGKGFTGWIARTPEERDKYVPTGPTFKYVLNKLAKNPDGLTKEELGANKNTMILSAINQLAQGQKIFCECTTGKFKLTARTRASLEPASADKPTEATDSDTDASASQSVNVDTKASLKKNARAPAEAISPVLACEVAILQFLKDSGGSADVQHILRRTFSRFSDRVTRKALANLRAQGEVKTQGKGGWAIYKLAPSPLTALGIPDKYSRRSMEKLRDDVKLYSEIMSLIGY